MEVYALAEQYFTPSPTSRHERRTVYYPMPDGRELVFETDGRFLQGRIRGTLELIKAIQGEDGESFLIWGAVAPVGIIAALLQPRSEVWMADVNERACELARTNARANGSNAAVDAEMVSAVGDRTFDVIATNPPMWRASPSSTG